MGAGIPVTLWFSDALGASRHLRPSPHRKSSPLFRGWELGPEVFLREMEIEGLPEQDIHACIGSGDRQQSVLWLAQADGFF